MRLLADGEITRAVTITVSGASAAAMAAVEKAGGTVTTDGARADSCGDVIAVAATPRMPSLAGRPAADAVRMAGRAGDDQASRRATTLCSCADVSAAV